MAEARSRPASLDLTDPLAVLREDPSGPLRGRLTPDGATGPAAQLPPQIESARAKATDHKDEAPGREENSEKDGHEKLNADQIVEPKEAPEPAPAENEGLADGQNEEDGVKL